MEPLRDADDQRDSNQLKDLTREDLTFELEKETKETSEGELQLEVGCLSLNCRGG